MFQHLVSSRLVMQNHSTKIPRSRLVTRRVGRSRHEFSRKTSFSGARARPQHTFHFKYRFDANKSNIRKDRSSYAIRGRPASIFPGKLCVSVTTLKVTVFRPPPPRPALHPRTPEMSAKFPGKTSAIITCRRERRGGHFITDITRIFNKKEGAPRVI